MHPSRFSLGMLLLSGQLIMAQTTPYTPPIFLPFKIGLYRKVMPQPMTIYLDEDRKHQLQDDELPAPAKTSSALPQ